MRASVPAVLAVLGLVHQPQTALGLDFRSSHDHHVSQEGDAPVERPKVFLDKSLRVVQYQLRRLPNEKLLLVETGTDDRKYAPVFQAILLREGMARGDREAALSGLTTINESHAVAELFAAIGSLDADAAADRRVAGELARMLILQPKGKLAQRTEDILTAVTSEHPVVRSTAMAALAAAGKSQSAISLGEASAEARTDLLQAVSLLPKDLTAEFAAFVSESLSGDMPTNVRQEALRAMRQLPVQDSGPFVSAANLISTPELRTAAVRTLLTIPVQFRPRAEAAGVVRTLVAIAEATPVPDRTTEEFVDAMQLADQLLPLLTDTERSTMRGRLREVSVRVVRIRTVEEEMRYDTAYFAVEAGRDVQIVLQNEDMMPHNLVITTPGKLQQVAAEGLEVGPSGGSSGKQYVPDSPDVLFATDMVNAHEAGRLTFKAPSVAGEYPFVCTFPRHWMRMYGVMVVVDDLDAWQKNPVKPNDPLGNTREFVAKWTVDDFASDLPTAVSQPNPDLGARLFKEATCQSCHQIDGVGGAVGPSLNGVLSRWKGDHAKVLQEILDPSHRIEAKYAVHTLLLANGQTVSGIVVEETKDSLSILENPESKDLRVVDRDDIDDMVKSSKSMMPKALLDNYSEEEVLELLAYVSSAKPAEKTAALSAYDEMMLAEVCGYVPTSQRIPVLRQDEEQVQLWYGELNPGGIVLRIVMELSKDGDGYTAEMNSLDQPGPKLKADEVTLSDTELVIQIKRVAGTFKGKLNESGDAATGTWSQGTNTIDLTLRLVDAIPEERNLEIWEGVLNAGLRKLTMRFRTVEGPDGMKAVYLDSPNEKLRNIVVTDKRKGKSVVFDIGLTKAVYEGELNEGGDAIAGKWKQSGVEIPLDLKLVETKSADPLPPKRPQTPKPPFPYDVEDVTFRNEQDDVTLAGTLTLPRGTEKSPAVVLISGSGPQDRDESLLGHKPFWILADHLTRQGFAVLRYDDRGTGESTGVFAAATSVEFSRDAEAAMDFLKANPRVQPERIGLMGHSEGGLIAPMVAARRSDLGFIVLLAGPGVDGGTILVSQGKLIADAEGIPADVFEKQVSQRDWLLDRIRKTPQSEPIDAKLVIAEYIQSLPEEERKDAEPSEAEVQGITQLTSPWFRYFITNDPAISLKQVSCPILAINGEKDLQVDPKLNLPAIRLALAEAPTKNVTVKELPSLNHLFQKCRTGSVSEYEQIEETFNPEALALISDWLKDVVR